MSSSIQQLAAKINGMEREIRAMATTPQLAYSSIEDGGSIDSNHDDGRTMAQFGGQFDGSFMAASLVGPTPPTASAPIVTAAIGGLTVRWDGTFTDADFAPMDFTRIEVHVSTDPAFVPDTAMTLVATIESPRGALPFIARAVGTYYVAFVARSQSGAAGSASATVGPFAVGKIGNDALASPVTADAGGISTTGFAVSGVFAREASVVIPIPVGFTRALVHVTAAASANNMTSFDDFLYVRASAILPGGATTNGSALYGVVHSGEWGTASASLAGVFSGLAPTGIIVSCEVQAISSWAANPANIANVDASVVFLK